MLADTRILTRHYSFTVLWERTAVQFLDGSTMDLHAVHKHPVCEKFLRAARVDDHWFVFDLRTIHRSFAESLTKAMENYVPGVIFFTLRQSFGSSREFCAGLLHNYLDVWLVPEDSPPGASQVVHGSQSCGKSLVNHPPHRHFGLEQAGGGGMHAHLGKPLRGLCHDPRQPGSDVRHFAKEASPVNPPGDDLAPAPLRAARAAKRAKAQDIRMHQEACAR